MLALCEPMVRSPTLLMVLDAVWPEALMPADSLPPVAFKVTLPLTSSMMLSLWLYTEAVEARMA